MKKLIYIMLVVLVAGCARYEDEIATYDVAMMLSCDDELDSGIVVELKDSRNVMFHATTDEKGVAHFTLPAGIYQGSASKVVEDDYVRKVINGNINDIVVEGNMSISMPVIKSMLSLRNPLVIKEIYCGGCQKDDGSGIFSYDKCIILYNNSSEKVSLDNIAIGMVEPYNAQSSTHSFLSGGKLAYQDETWIPAINGIWYFQDGQFIQPYSELVVNVCGAIDNTTTYSKSVNYANEDYYCMYDPSYTSSNGESYSNTMYYPTPSSLIPTSHYLLAVKYGQSNAWPMSQTSPALILFKTQGVTPREYAETPANIIYPDGKSGNLVYACLSVERSWVLDAVEVYNQAKLSDCKKRITPDLDNGYVVIMNGYGHSAVRKVEKTVDGHAVYQDTNNSSNDFYEADNVSIR